MTEPGPLVLVLLGASPSSICASLSDTFRSMFSSSGSGLDSKASDMASIASFNLGLQAFFSFVSIDADMFAKDAAERYAARQDFIACFLDGWCETFLPAQEKALSDVVDLVGNPELVAVVQAAEKWHFPEGGLAQRFFQHPGSCSSKMDPKLHMQQLSDSLKKAHVSLDEWEISRELIASRGKMPTILGPLVGHGYSGPIPTVMFQEEKAKHVTFCNRILEEIPKAMDVYHTVLAAALFMKPSSETPLSAQAQSLKKFRGAI